MDQLEIAEALDALYREIPDVHCKKLCAESCGPILCSAAEWERVKAIAGPLLPFDWKTLSCPALRDGQCSAYAVRPLVCRLFGAVKKMRCPHGCKPKRWVTDEEAARLIEAAQRLSRGAVGGPANEATLMPDFFVTP